MTTKQRKDLTFHYNLKRGRHGWLRLTPAYSIKLVYQILDNIPRLPTYVLDPFAGTGTTGLVCGERGISSDLLDINDFLVWFTRAKTRNYSTTHLQTAYDILQTLKDNGLTPVRPLDELWVPPISNIARWWNSERLMVLANLHVLLTKTFPNNLPIKDLFYIAFCRLVIEVSNVAFNHHSMSFKSNQAEQRQLFFEDEQQHLFNRFIDLVEEVLRSAQLSIKGKIQVRRADARAIPIPSGGLYDCVITSPPYPNRMSYIRELRPYMYWLGYLVEARDAGELDWQAIGGTWGVATSRLAEWHPNGITIDDDNFNRMIRQIQRQSHVLANYVHKYFIDMKQHFMSIFETLASGARIYYVVGNSKFYDTLVPTEKIYAQLMQAVGFDQIAIEVIRKRNSKKELYEYLVSATKP
ncbi:MAG: hypothetical protein CUN55_13295 [Phototrophicales bacterium]|nr:MAG: hypothetical protein CUN55_13295 [Phototrophicales bacterium]